ncbi:hypothetical protein N0V90_004062 [Kalmusia sp. IMI 367209]|nr:hypothetical protein N0V90_004062 [Kalmusia sp. IMI 367209]
MPGHAYNPDKSIPSLSGKVVLVTGANAGIGKQTALDLSKHSPSQVWVAARNVQSGNEAVAEIKTFASPQTSVVFLDLDLASFASVRQAAKRVIAESNRLDILVLNAGMMGGEPGVTEDGYEKQFATNHMGHALLLKLLTPLLLKASQERIGVKARVVILSSAAHKSGVIPKNGIDFATINTAQEKFMGITKYAQSKLANAVYASVVAKRYPEITIVAINPGEVKTGLFSKGSASGGWVIKLLNWIVAPMLWVPVDEGAKNSLWAATSEEAESGRFYDPIGKTGGESEIVRKGKLGEELWEWTERELGRHEAEVAQP